MHDRRKIQLVIRVVFPDQGRNTAEFYDSWWWFRDRLDLKTDFPADFRDRR